MDPEIKKKALRMLTYAMYVVTAAHKDEIAAGAVNWLSQASFQPPLLMVAVKVESNLHRLIRYSGTLAISILADDQKQMAAAFFGPAKIADNTINGYPCENGETGTSVLPDVPPPI